MRVPSWASLSFLVLLIALLASPALAQSTGGSFGGGSFGGGGGSGGSGGSGSWGGGSGSGSSGSWGGSGSSGSWGGSGSSGSWGNDRNNGSSWGGSSPGSSTSSGGGGGGVLGGGFCCFLLVIGIVGLAIFAKSRKSAGAPRSGPMMTGGAPGGGMPAYHGRGAMYVNQLSLGIDWRARRALQEVLSRLAQTGDTRSPQGLANLLRETVLALRRAELSWLYVAQKNAGGPLSPQNAEAQFNQLATGARAAFQHELVRGAGGQVQALDAPQMQANRNEGEGTVVVHLIIAAYRPLSEMQAPDANQIRAALDNRAALTAEQLGALEVVWSPAADNDRMSTAELEQFYPDLRLIDPNSIAGRIFCTFCRGPFAMELLSCPHCGAPAESSRDNRAPR